MKAIAAATAASKRTDTLETRATPSPSSSSAPRAKISARRLDDCEDRVEEEDPRIIGLDQYQQSIYDRRIKDLRISHQKLFLDTYGVEAIEKWMNGGFAFVLPQVRQQKESEKLSRKSRLLVPWVILGQ